VDATDRIRIDDCREELSKLLLEEVSFPFFHTQKDILILNYIAFDGS
jgi:hypothetical protein